MDHEDLIRSAIDLAAKVTGRYPYPTHRPGHRVSPRQPRNDAELIYG